MPRTGQPAIRHVAAVQRAVAVLDALADGEPELGHERDRAAHGDQREHGLPAARDARRGGARRARRRHRPLPARAAAAAARQRRSRPPRPPRGRASPPRRPLRGDRGDGDAVGARRARGRHRRLRPEPGVRAERRSARPPERRARDGGRQGLPRLRRRAPRRARSSLHAAARSPTGRGSTAEVDQATERGWAQATGEREEDLNAVAAPVRRRPWRAGRDPRRPGPGRPLRRRRDASGVGPLLEHAARISAACGTTVSHRPLEPDRRA